MNESAQNAPSKESQLMLESLQRAVTQALDSKKRLGQYAVIWKNGKPVFVGVDAPGERL